MIISKISIWINDLFNQYDKKGSWTGMLSDEDAASLDTERVEYMTGKAGSITIHNARTLHYSPSSKSPVPRPLLLNCYTSADAKPYTPHPSPTVNEYKVVRGQRVQWAHHDPRPCQIPPDWSAGYTSIYAAQSGEDEPKSMIWIKAEQRMKALAFFSRKRRLESLRMPLI